MLATADAESCSSSLPLAARPSPASVTWFGGPVYGIKAFTGREWDPETSLYYYRARYYDPKVGRFLSEDPIGFEGGIHFYKYAGNNPGVFRDPSGLDLSPPGGWGGCEQANGPRASEICHPLPPDYNECVVSCIEKWSPSTIYTGGGQTANAAGNMLTGGTGRSGFDGVTAHATSWQHKCLSRFGPRVRHVGRFAGRAAIVLTVAEGAWDFGAIVQCFDCCTNPNRIPGLY
jgi:RHS repeat-associated protein